MTQRTVEDRLREEYFFLLPEIKRALHQLRTEVTHLFLPATLSLKHHEKIEIEVRVKECDSAIDSPCADEKNKHGGSMKRVHLTTD